MKNSVRCFCVVSMCVYLFVVSKPFRVFRLTIMLLTTSIKRDAELDFLDMMLYLYSIIKKNSCSNFDLDDSLG